MQMIHCYIKKKYKLLGVINSNQINNWKNKKGVSSWISVTFNKLENTQKPDHLNFSFKATHLSGFLSFHCTLLDSDNKKIVL